MNKITNKVKTAIIVVLFLISSNTLNCYATCNYLDVDFWNDCNNQVKSVVVNNLGVTINIDYNCYCDKKKNISVYSNISNYEVLRDVDIPLCIELFCVIKNGNHTDYIKFNSDNTSTNGNDDIIKNISSKCIRKNNCYSIIGEFDYINLNQDTTISTYLVINNKRYLMYDNEKLFNLYFDISGTGSSLGDTTNTNSSNNGTTFNLGKNESTNPSSTKSTTKFYNTSSCKNNNDSTKYSKNNDELTNYYNTNIISSTDIIQQTNFDYFGNQCISEGHKNSLSITSTLLITIGILFLVIGIILMITSLIDNHNIQSK